MELHVWGPTSDLPSLDAECLAAILYFQNTLPQGTWTLVPNHSPNSNPFRRLPALRNDQAWVAGFQSITQYLTDTSHGKWDLDADHDDLERADCEAYTSFLHSKGFPLLDLSLYVSSTNYTAFTRRALGDLLPWPQSWVVSHQLREKAKVRTEHLGLSALDVDATQEDEKDDVGLKAKIPKSLRKPKQTVSSILGRGAQKTRFRLDAVTEDFLEPLQSKLGDRDWLVGRHMSSVDCLAIAVISLMQLQDLPQAWLRETLAVKYRRLDNWARKHSSTIFGGVMHSATARQSDVTKTELPWVTPLSLSLAETSTDAIESLISVVPILRLGYERNEVVAGNGHQVSRGEEKQVLYTKLRKEQRLYSQLMATCIGSASILAWLLHIGVLGLPHFQAQPTRRSFGEAGAFLGL